jgi:hypothetical protein
MIFVIEFCNERAKDIKGYERREVLYFVRCVLEGYVI